MHIKKTDMVCIPRILDVFIFDIIVLYVIPSAMIPGPNFIAYAIHLLQCVLRWGLLTQSPPFCYFLNFPSFSELTVAIEYHVYIWQMSPAKYECDLNNLTGTFTISKIEFTGKLTRGH